ncbi:hypothetical protein SPBR_05416 [Sporothrix brasiliensis 5110]|uniref:Uncharacterized protein n=1 Tax=Sporothrix brasiliensis 5110 TaxID=1398154 RepID=A0A0C2EMH8_9PEZI|nr:uncharacterized protein SPBR_05416 [Sporothrix brasiliensis 5110]KIH87294.1 hypothetical protein SPBR_05416 [Sporothrix brasiliensis 5110]
MANLKKEDENAATPRQELLEDAFEARRQEIVRQCAGFASEVYEKDQFTEYDLWAVKFLLWPLQGLLRHDPTHRLSAKEAAASIAWTDYRRDT